MRQPLISVVVPIYNTEKYLEQCIISIVSQTFKDLELICVDDGSTDDSLNLLKKLAELDSRIVVIHRKKSSGSAAVPRNVGLSYAKGKYIIFLDSDDYFDCHMLEKMYMCAEKECADLVMCDNYVVSSVDDSIKDFEGELHHKYIKQNGVFSYKDIPDTIFQISNAAIWHKLILRELLVQYQLIFQENVPILDDIYFVNLLLVLSKKIFILDEKLVFYRAIRSGGQTTKIEMHKESVYTAFKKLNQYLIENGLYDEVKISLQNWMLQTLEWWFYSIKNYEVAKELFYIYKKCYFKNLGLMDIDALAIEDRSQSFYYYVVNGEYRPSVGEILNFISPMGANMVLYGAGKIGKTTHEYIIRNEPLHRIVLWCDKNAEKMNNPLIKKPEEIINTKYDVIIIAIADNQIILEVKHFLKSLGVDKGKVYTM